MDGESRSHWAPTRVARAFEKEMGELPRPYGDLVSTLDALTRSQCFSALTEMLSRRDHSSREAHDKLIHLGFREPEVEEALSRAQRARFLDDARFMRTFIDERLRRGWGRRKIELELRRRGVDPSALPDYPDAYFSYDSDLERAQELLGRKAVPQAHPFEKLVRHLVGKGFSYDVAMQAVRARLADQDDPPTM